MYKRQVEILEYRLVPLMISVVNIGEDLSASALTRCLGREDSRTNISRCGFGVIDYVLFAVGIAFIMLYFLEMCIRDSSMSIIGPILAASNFVDSITAMGTVVGLITDVLDGPELIRPEEAEHCPYPFEKRILHAEVEEFCKGAQRVVVLRV